MLAAGEGAPAEWVGAKLAERAGVPASLRDAARAAVAAAQHGGGAPASARVDVPELGATVEVVAVAAVGLHRAPTDVRALLHDALRALVRQAQAVDVELGVTIDPGVPAALSLDPEKIAWAVSALVGNAMRYVRHGTRQMPGGSIAVTAALDGAKNELCLVVEDDGPGMPADVAGRLFQRAPGAPHALGLALMVVRDIVTAHGGSLDLASSTGAAEHGTTVTLRIPVG